jgi:hypothetical protein
MAKITGSTNNSNWTYKLEVSESNVNISNNTSQVTVTAYIGRASSRSYLGGSWSGSITVSGSTQNMSGTISYPTYINGGAWLTLATKTFTVSHNADGSKTASISSSFRSSDFTPSSASASGNVTLTTIPRSSSVSCSGGDIESTTKINITRASSSFTHTITYSFGSLSGTIATKTSSTSINWTIPASFYSQIPNTNSGTGTISCTTYSGNTSVGTKTCQFTAKVTNANPIIGSYSYQDTNLLTTTLTGDNQKIIKNKSYLSFEVGEATALKEATISSYVINFNNQNYTVTPTSGVYELTITPNVSTNTTATLTVTDSRGNKSISSLTIQILDWEKPYGTYSVKRQDNFYSKTFIKVNPNYSSLDGLNSLTIKFRYKKVTESTYSSYINLSAYQEYNINLNNLYDYDIQIKLEDLLDYQEYDIVLPKGIPLLYLDTKNMSVGVNGFPIGKEQFYNKGTFYNEGDVIINGDNVLTRIAGLGELAQTPTATNWNSACGSSTGFYKGTNFSNSPNSEASFLVLHIAFSNVYQRQVAFSLSNSNGVYTRIMNNGTWSSWISVI